MPWQDRFNKPDSRFTVEIVEEIIEALRDGRSMNEICKDERMPSRETVRNWCDADAELALAITRAREDGYHDRAERAVADAKTAPDAALGRLAFDAERWFLGKVSKGFADKVIVGGDADNPVRHAHRIDMSGLSDAALREIANLATDQ